MGNENMCSVLNIKLELQFYWGHNKRQVFPGNFVVVRYLKKIRVNQSDKPAASKIVVDTTTSNNFITKLWNYFFIKE